MGTPDLSCSRFLLPPMHSEGRRFVLIAMVLTLVLTWFATVLVIPGLLLSYGVYLFFRDPERILPPDHGLAVSPADGIVSMITKCAIPAELSAGTAEVCRVSIFMSVLDVHVNRVPTKATVKKICYIVGKFLNASLDKASEDNERYLYLLELADGREMAVVQIAGLIARRIVSFVEAGKHLDRGERLGLIRFGSRVDVYLPVGTEPLVAVGQTMIAGETPLAKI